MSRCKIASEVMGNSAYLKEIEEAERRRRREGLLVGLAVTGWVTSFCLGGLLYVAWKVAPVAHWPMLLGL